MTRTGSSADDECDRSTSRQDEIRRRAEALGPWFHNIELNGVRTAPDHFLGDYPAVKWQSFADAIPQDLTGKSVLDIGCNGGFYSIEMKQRGAERVLGIDFDDDYLAQARFAAEVTGLDIEFRKLSVYDVGALGERFDVVLFMGVLYHLRHPLLALDLIHEHVASDLLVFQSMQRGSQEVDAGRRRTTPSGRRSISTGPATRSCTSSSTAMPTIRPTGGCRTAACVEAMLRSAGFEILQHPEDEVYICRRVEAPERRRRGLSGAREHVHDRSRDDLERAEQQVPLGSRARPGLEPLRRDGDRRRAGDQGREPRPSARARRHVADRSRLSSSNMEGKGVLDHVDVVAVHGFPLDWNLWQIHEWPAKIDEIRAVTDLPIWVTEVGISTFGAEEVQVWGLQRTAELLIGKAPRIHWYSLYDLPRAWEATTRHREAEGSSYYRHFYMGLLREDGTPKPAARGLRRATPPRWASASGSISRTTASTTRSPG